MNRLLAALLTFLTLNSFSQPCITPPCTTLVAYNRIETFNWDGNWISTFSTGYSALASTSPSSSAVFYGISSASSSTERNTYKLINITGLNSSKLYRFKFRLGSYRLTAPPSVITKGVDTADYIDVRISMNGGVSYTTEIRITGFSNAYWDYNTNGTILKTRNGNMTTYTPTGGGDRTALSDGYSVIELDLLNGLTQFAVEIATVANSSGEEWWFDDFELWSYDIGSSLPIELVYFKGIDEGYYNHIMWVTSSETNNHYFTIERSLDMINWIPIHTQLGAGSSNKLLTYEYKDYDFELNKINYYRLNQTDYDGKFEQFYTIAVDNSRQNSENKIIKRTTIYGKEINELYTGLYLEIYQDGSAKKFFKN